MGQAEILLRLQENFQPSQPSCFLENNLTVHAHVTFSARADISFRLHGLYADFFSSFARAENPSPVLRPAITSLRLISSDAFLATHVNARKF